MKRRIIIIMVFLLTISFVSAICEDIGMDVTAVEKNDSCYTFFSVVFEDIGCDYNCYDNISKFEVVHGGEIIKDVTDVITTYLGLSFHDLQCDAEDVSLILYGLDGAEYCRKDFVLVNEYQEWQDYITPKNDTNVTVTEEEMVFISKEEITPVPLESSEAESSTPEPVIEEIRGQASTTNTLFVNDVAEIRVKDKVVGVDFIEGNKKIIEFSKLSTYIPLTIISLIISGLIFYFVLNLKGKTIKSKKKKTKNSVKKRKSK